jgi:hypothetical protein
MAALLNVAVKDVLVMAARHDVPVIYDEGLGHMFSVLSAKTLMVKMLSGGHQSVGRFDRQAMIWRLLEGDPARVGELPPFDKELEKEIERVAQLDEPMRSARSMALVDQFRDVKIILESAESLSSGPSRPRSPDDASSCSVNAQLLSACEQKFSALL